MGTVMEELYITYFTFASNGAGIVLRHPHIDGIDLTTRGPSDSVWLVPTWVPPTPEPEE
jgi:hypothetical protein